MCARSHGVSVWSPASAASASAAGENGAAGIRARSRRRPVRSDRDRRRGTPPAALPRSPPRAVRSPRAARRPSRRRPTPSRVASRPASMEKPRARASSIMLRQTTSGSPVSATSRTRARARSRFFASPTRTTAAGRRRQQDVAGDPLVLRERKQRGGARRVADAVAPAPDDDRRALGHLDRRAWVVGDRHVLAGQRAEQDALADVRVADEDDGAASRGPPELIRAR